MQGCHPSLVHVAILCVETVHTVFEVNMIVLKTLSMNLSLMKLFLRYGITFRYLGMEPEWHSFWHPTHESCRHIQLELPL